MTNRQIEDALTELAHREPFLPFVVEMVDGTSLIVPCPPAFDEAGAGFIDSKGALTDFWFRNVKAIRPVTLEPVS